MEQNRASSTEVVTVAASLTVTVSQEVVEQNTGYLPWVLGDNLAGMVDTYVMEQQLGYYPALDYFRDLPQAVDPALLTLIDQIAIFTTDYARRELRHRLMRAFSGVVLEQVHCTAYTMPRVRPSRSGALEGLAAHYSPNTLKVELLLKMIGEEALEGIETLALNRLTQWGREPFSRFVTNGAQKL
jgi:hypothetical protein